jgi:subtilase family serine protease
MAMDKRIKIFSFVNLFAAMVLPLLYSSLYAAPPSLTLLNKSLPAWAQASAKVRPANSNNVIGFRIYLGLHNQSNAEALVQSISDPSSPQYGQYLTPAQFKQQFSPTDAEVAAVSNWLQSKGFTIVEIADNNHYVSATGSVAQANAAFNMTLNYYQHPGGKILRSPDKAPSIPSSLSNVTGISGLDESGKLIHPFQTTSTDCNPNDTTVGPVCPPPVFIQGQPCSQWYGQLSTKTTPSLDHTVIPEAYNQHLPWMVCGYFPSQIQGAYGIDKSIASGNDGSGVTVVITELSGEHNPTLQSDLNQYSSLHGLPAINKSNFQEVDLPVIAGVTIDEVSDLQGWYGEEAIDVDAVHTTAPRAKIVDVIDFSDYDNTSVLMDNVVSHHYGDIVSNSWGYTGEPGQVLGDTVSDAQATDEALLQGVLEGITFLFSSGDNGDNYALTQYYAEYDGVGQAYVTPNWPASSPLVTAVGGTSMDIDQNNRLQFLTGWELGSAVLSNGAWTPDIVNGFAPGIFPPGAFLSGSGGGTSVYYAEPIYQLPVVPIKMAKTAGLNTPYTANFPLGRVIPDISMNADPSTGLRVGFTQTYLNGSTKYTESRYGGTSLSAPLMAGMLALLEQKSGHPYGLINPLLYLKYFGGFDLGTFIDVTPPSSPVAEVRPEFNNGQNAAGGFTYYVRTFEYDSFRIPPADLPLSIHALPGYDNVTGIGSPGPNFLKDMSQFP